MRRTLRHAIRLSASLLLLPLLVLWPAILPAQQFDNFDGTGDGTFDGFQFDDGSDGGGGGTGLTLSEPGGLIEGGRTGDIELNLGAPAQGVFESFPGVTGPVTSVSQPATSQGGRVVLRALDRMLGQPSDIELAMDQTVVFGRIAIRALECRFPSADPEADAYARLEVLDLAGQTLFEGWMIASSPALNALEHSRYDVWVLGCAP